MWTNYLIIVHVTVVCYNNFVMLPQNVEFIMAGMGNLHILPVTWHESSFFSPEMVPPIVQKKFNSLNSNLHLNI
jgi:hypothetical protein